MFNFNIKSLAALCLIMSAMLFMILLIAIPIAYLLVKLSLTDFFKWFIVVWTITMMLVISLNLMIKVLERLMNFFVEIGWLD